MSIPAIILGAILILVVLWETFESIILPRSVIRRLRLTRLFYQMSWKSFLLLRPRGMGSSFRESYLSAFGPLSLLALIALWVIFLIFGFAVVLWGLGSPISSSVGGNHFLHDLYFSGTTFFTLGLGDMTPNSAIARTLAVVEAGVGLGFVAIVIGYVPVIYASFSRRESGISLLDARAGSPPCASEMLIRHAKSNSLPALTVLLDKFEMWASDLMESHLSYPVASYYRSQHDRESWISAIAGIMDACALISLRFEGAPEWESALHWQAYMTYAMCRHAIVDLSMVLDTPPASPLENRLPHEEFLKLIARLERANIALRKDDKLEERLSAIRSQYEPYLHSLSRRLLMPLPPWTPDDSAQDNWESSAWGSDGHL